jgi:Cdc6-like AAA superfamily ATPase
MRFNPFRPNSIVSPEMLHGRTEELSFIQQSLFQSHHGNPQHFLIEGERCLGKSSLFLMFHQFASGQRPHKT